MNDTLVGPIGRDKHNYNGDLLIDNVDALDMLLATTHWGAT